MTSDRLHEFLKGEGVAYEVEEHELAYDAQHLAASEHVTGWDVAKPVMLTADGQQVMAVLPAPMGVDLDKASEVLGSSVTLSAEDDFEELFPDCELGAAPPFGHLYGVRVLMDRSMQHRDRVICRDGSHTQTISLTLDDYVRLAEPEVVEIGIPQD